MKKHLPIIWFVLCLIGGLVNPTFGASQNLETHWNRNRIWNTHHDSVWGTWAATPYYREHWTCREFHLAVAEKNGVADTDYWRRHIGPGSFPGGLWLPVIPVTVATGVTPPTITLPLFGKAPVVAVVKANTPRLWEENTELKSKVDELEKRNKELTELLAKEMKRNKNLATEKTMANQASTTTTLAQAAEEVSAEKIAPVELAQSTLWYFGHEHWGAIIWCLIVISLGVVVLSVQRFYRVPPKTAQPTFPKQRVGY